MLRNDDADIDALLGSVVGGNGQPAEFPVAPPQADVIPLHPTRKRSARANVEALSRKLAAAIVENEKARVIIDPRTVSVRFSRLRAMSASALHYWQAVQDDREDTIAMRFGRGVHALVLDQPVARCPFRRGTTAHRAFEEKHAGAEILSVKEWDRAHGIFEAIKRHPIANEALFAGTVLEETIEWELMGRACTSRPDARAGTERLVDLKTTRCAAPRKFELDAMWRGYHGQFSFYGRAIKERFGSAPKESLCVAVETVKPFAITVLQFTPGALLEGEKLWRSWFEQLLVCEAGNHWPAYTEVIEPIDVAASEDVQLIIDGEEFDFDED